MLSACLLTIWAAAPSPPPAPLADAAALAARAAWDELYLAFSTQKPSRFKAEERRAIAAALDQGCEALVEKDPVLAFSLAEAAARFNESPGGLWCLARAAQTTQQPSEAQEALQRGASHFPDDARFPLALGELLLQEREFDKAEAALARVPKSAPEHRKAELLRARVRKEAAQEREARRTADRQASAVARGQPAPAEKKATAASTSSGLSYESGTGPGGLRTRSNKRFRFKYFNGARDFGQRAEYEGQVAAALEEAYLTTQRFLGEAREQPVDVVLYSKEEFELHHGAAAADRIAGLYGDGAMRINDAAQLTPQNKATLVHEYVHALIDEVCGGKAMRLPLWLNEGTAEHVEWRYQGHEGPPRAIAAALKTAARAGRLPSLDEMAGGGPFVAQADAGLRYAYAGAAVTELVRLSGSHGGAHLLLAFIRDLSAGQAFDEAFQRRFGRSAKDFEASLQSSLKR